MRREIDVITGPGSLKIYHLGPPLKSGRLPSVFYFSLSGEESLALDPYNQPAVILASRGTRVFSLTLPGHEGAFPHHQAIKAWGEALSKGSSLIEEFIRSCETALNFLIEKGYADPQRIATAGLSRGAYVAAQLAAKDNRISTIVGFAPLTRLETLRDFKNISDLPQLAEFSLEHLIPNLLSKKLRFYIGNHDTLVGTENCFSFVHTLTESAYRHNHRFPPVGLIVYPSIGHKGHGTPPEIFESGASWLAKVLKDLKDLKDVKDFK